MTLTHGSRPDTENIMSKNIISILAVILTLAGLVASVSASQQNISDDAISGATLCWNEAGDNRFDCSAIIVMRMRSARAREPQRTFAEELYHLHGDGRVRHPERAALRSDRAHNVQRHDSRPWLGDIRRDLHEPLGWPSRLLPWDTHRPKFQRLFAFVQGVLDGTTRDRCRGIPTRWGGPRVDHELIERHQAAGRVIVDCGATRNIFLE